MVSKDRKELNQLKRRYGYIKLNYDNLKIINNVKANEILYLRRQLKMIGKKCSLLLSRGKQYTDKKYIGRKYAKKR